MEEKKDAGVLCDEILRQELETALHEKDEVKRSKYIQRSIELMTALNDYDSLREKIFDNEQRRSIERERISAELSKSEMDTKRVVTEVMKVVVPAGIQILTLIIWSNALVSVEEFEKTGRLVTSASRFLGFPRILK